MNKITVYQIKLFIASSAELKETRDKIALSLHALSRQHKNSRFSFEPCWWEEVDLSPRIAQPA